MDIVEKEEIKEDTQTDAVEETNKEQIPVPSKKNTEKVKQPEDEKVDVEENNEDKSKGKKPEDVDLENPEDVSDALTERGIDYNALTEEYLQSGKLSDKSMATLAAAGIPAEMVNDYIRGCEARAELERNELAQCVGGREAMDEIITWAAHNLERDEIIAFNAIRNKFEREAVLTGLKVRMEQKEGKIPDYQKGTGDTPGISGFRSQAEMFAAIKDPRYNKDEAYREDVRKKIAAGREAGIDLGIY